MKKISCLFWGLLLFSNAIQAQNVKKIKPTKVITTQVKEPSDIAIHPFKENSFFMVSDNGFVYEINQNGDIVKESLFRGIDTEAVFAKDSVVYVIEEFGRKINQLKIDNLEPFQKNTIQFGGGRNKGFESFTYNESKKKFVVITEKDPILLFELDEKMTVVNEIDLSKIARDISASTFYNNKIWLLSDEDRTLFQLDSLTYKVENKWLLPIINPEGIAFTKDNQFIVVSDDRMKMYFFNTSDLN
jgi:uncharacterized protein YjiK